MTLPLTTQPTLPMKHYRINLFVMSHTIAPCFASKWVTCKFYSTHKTFPTHIPSIFYNWNPLSKAYYSCCWSTVCLFSLLVDLVNIWFLLCTVFQWVFMHCFDCLHAVSRCHEITNCFTFSWVHKTSNFICLNCS